MADKWVKMPKEAQITMGRDAYARATGGLGTGVAIIGIIGALMLYGCAKDDTDPVPGKHAPRPSHTSTQQR
jgi:hypothetical protein